MSVVLLIFLLTSQAAAPSSLEPWLGTFQAGPEPITISWNDGGLHLLLDLISLPVDGQWHVTNSTFGVRRRASWIAGEGAIRVEEQHNYKALEPGDESGWTYELRLDNHAAALVKVVQQPGGSDLVVRRYTRSGGETP